jgi:hypothetical protein
VVYLGVEVLEFKKQMFIKQVAFQNIKREGVWQELIQNKYLHS